MTTAWFNCNWAWFWIVLPSLPIQISLDRFRIGFLACGCVRAVIRSMAWSLCASFVIFQQIFLSFVVFYDLRTISKRNEKCKRNPKKMKPPNDIYIRGILYFSLWRTTSHYYRSSAVNAAFFCFVCLFRLLKRS